MRRRPRPLGLVALGLTATLLACSGSSSDAGVETEAGACALAPPCRDDEGKLRYDPPSYKTEIRPILNAACVPCHRPGSLAANLPETTYSELSGQREGMLSEVEACLMPLPSGPQLSSAQRIALEEWLSCGGPNN